MSETPYRLTSLTLLLLAVALMVLAAEVFSAPITIVASKWGPAQTQSSGMTNGITSENTTLWQAATVQGVENGIPARTSHVTNVVTHYGVDNAGSAKASALINLAITECPSNGVVYLPAGRYLIDTTNIIGKSDVTLRGAGTNTILVATNVNPVIHFYWDTTPTYNYVYQGNAVTAGLEKGSTNITVTWGQTMANQSDYPIRPGFPIMIARYNSSNQFENPLVTGSSGTITNGSTFGILYRSIHRCISTNATGVTFWPPLAGSMAADRTDLPARVVGHPGPRRAKFGVEDLAIEMNVLSAARGIFFDGTDQCWITGVDVYRRNGVPLNYPLDIENSGNFEVRQVAVNTDQDNAGTSSAGLLVNTASFGLVEKAMIIKIYPCIEVQNGVGNIFAYTFTWNTNDYGLYELDCNHGAHSAFNLWEGNIAGRFISDGYHGSGSHDTLYRNWFHGLYTVAGGPTNLGLGYAINLKRWSRSYAIAGNVIGFPAPYTNSYPGFSYGEPFSGVNNGTNAPPWPDFGTGTATTAGWNEFDTNVLATTTLRGNFYFFTNAIPAAESLGGATLSNSLYRSSVPSSLAVRIVDPTSPTAVNFTNNAAGFRYLHGFWPN